MSSCEEEVLRIGKKVERMIQGTKSMDSACELLEALASLPIDAEVLANTRIGVAVNSLRKKTTDDQIAKKAKSLIKEWKKRLETKSNQTKEPSLARIDSGASNLSEENSRSSVKETTTPPQPKPAPPPASASTKRLHADEVRNKCAEMILNALKSRDLPEGTLDPEDIAISIEKHLFEVHRGTTDKYKSAVRSRVFNLRDKNNPALRENVLTGVVTAERFATMTSEEMASDEMRRQRESFTKQAIKDHQMSVQEGTPSDMFKCGKCGKKNCTYTQVQTRSADEPMTTFVFCRECGNRWKFC